MYDLHEFLETINLAAISGDKSYNDGQLGNIILLNNNELPDITNTDIVIVGINEQRGEGMMSEINSPDAIRTQLYKLHYWHTDIQIADIGNIKTGATLADSYAAVQTVVAALLQMNKTVILLGGSHDITLAQYAAYKDAEKLIEVSVVDATIDLTSDEQLQSANFIMEMLTSEPNIVKHYNHIGFQSYLVHPRILETIDKLRFDCFRVGMAKEHIEEMEPVIRNTNMLSFDMAAIKYSDAPANDCSPNGFSGEEACMLTRFAGMSPALNSFGIYGYKAGDDIKDLTAKQIAQMLWYFIDGKSRSKREASFEDKHNFNEFHTAFSETDTVFLQSKRTGRWWMQLPDKKLIACSYKDYISASNNEIPERWLRSQERI